MNKEQDEIRAEHIMHNNNQENKAVYYDIEAGVEDNFNNQLRLGFIRKVYGILSFQLLITAAFVGLTFIPEVSLFLYRYIGLFYAAMCLSIIILLSLVCVPKLYRTVPSNYILLTLWTICEAYMVATASAFNPPELVLIAAGMTAAVVVSLTIYAWHTKTDFTVLGGLLFALTTIMLFWGILILIFGFFLYTLYCVLGVILFSVYLVFDTQLILGRFGIQYSIDDYILAAINIYIDIIQLFLYILQLLRRD